MTIQNFRSVKVGAWGFLTDRRYRWFHAVLIGFALLINVVSSYLALLDPASGGIGSLANTKLQAIQQAQYLILILYATVVFNLRGGLAAVGLTGATSLPFVFLNAFKVQNITPAEFANLVTQTAFVLLMGLFMAVLYDLIRKERERRMGLTLQVDQATTQLHARAKELADMDGRLGTSTKQLQALNQLIQRRVVELYGDPHEVAAARGAARPSYLPVMAVEETPSAFLRRLEMAGDTREA
jgi:type II secretory pathway component PulM